METTLLTLLVLCFAWALFLGFRLLGAREDILHLEIRLAAQERVSEAYLRHINEMEGKSADGGEGAQP